MGVYRCHIGNFPHVSCKGLYGACISGYIWRSGECQGHPQVGSYQVGICFRVHKVLRESRQNLKVQTVNLGDRG